MPHTIGTGDFPIFFVGHGAIDAANSGNTLDRKQFGRAEEGTGIAINIQMRLFTNKDHQALLRVAGIIKAVDSRLNDFTIAIFKFNLRPQ